MPPPELSGNTPVADIVCPVKVGLIHSRRNQSDLAVLNCLYRRFDQLIHFNEPLFLDHRFYGCMTAVMCSYIMRIVFNTNQKTHAIKLCNDLLTTLVPVKSFVFSAVFINGCIIIQDIDFRKVMTLSDFKIVRVMCRCDFNNTGTEFHVYIAVGNDRDLTVYNRKHYLFADHILISVIVRIYSNSRVSEHGLRTRRSKLNELRGADTSIFFDQRIFDVPQMTCLLLILYFRIRNGSIADRAPVDNTAALVDIAFFVHLDEHFGNCLIAAFIHGETLSVPVTG